MYVYCMYLTILMYAPYCFMIPHLVHFLVNYFISLNFIIFSVAMVSAWACNMIISPHLSHTIRYHKPLVYCVWWWGNTNYLYIAWVRWTIIILIRLLWLLSYENERIWRVLFPSVLFPVGIVPWTLWGEMYNLMNHVPSCVTENPL